MDTLKRQLVCQFICGLRYIQWTFCVILYTIQPQGWANRKFNFRPAIGVVLSPFSGETPRSSGQQGNLIIIFLLFPDSVAIIICNSLRQ